MGYCFLEPGTISIHDDRWLTYPWGVNGGLPGRRSEKILKRVDGSEEMMPSKCDRIAVNAGDILYFNTWGGGGCGDPSSVKLSELNLMYAPVWYRLTAQSATALS